MTILALETSCDETSASVMKDGLVLSNPVGSQIEIHREYGGVVPEIATREHLKNIPLIVGRALKESGLSIEDVDVFAATRGPGLPSALMTGYRSAQAMAFVSRRPLHGIHHHEAHLYSPWIDPTNARMDPSEIRPSVSLIVSGGHTLLVQVMGPLNHRLLGGTIDDAAGECFDKTSKMLGLPYPGGPVMDRLAAGGDPKAFDFPRPKIHDETDDFSFSGLKTAVRYFLRDHPEIPESKAGLQNLCASIQEAIVDVLIKKTLRAARRSQVNLITASGGVICNSRLRLKLLEACRSHGLELKMTAPAFSTDNAAMIAAVAWMKVRFGRCPADRLDWDVLPGWSLDHLNSNRNGQATVESF